jgi:hypothetical protein
MAPGPAIRAWVQAAYVITAALEHGSDRVTGY